MLTIDLAAIQSNYSFLKQQVGPDTDVAAVVKAYAYGLGVGKIAPVLSEAGVRVFYVATLEEGIELRDLLPGQASICIFNGFRNGAEALYRMHHLTPILNGPNEVERFISQKTRVLARLMIDTGMNRLGFRPEELEDCLARGLFDEIEIETVLTHFACADEPDHAMTDQQVKIFDELVQNFPGVRRSVCNGPGTMNVPSVRYEEVRCGMPIYGLNPDSYRKNPMKRVVSLKAQILQVKQALKNETAGYSATHRFHENTMLAIVELGYADGFHRAGSNRAKLYWTSIPCPVVGRVSMDTIICDIGAVPEDQRPVAGDHMEVIGPNQSADELAQDWGTIGYEILTSLGKRYKRVYLHGE